MLQRIKRSRLKALRESKGQAVVMTVFGLWLFAMFGALSVDVGLLVNERRELQNAADKAALAGALEILLEDSDTGSAAISSAEDWAAANGVDAGDHSIGLVYGDVCFGTSTAFPAGVEVSITREPASFLVGLLGVDSWEASADAVACAGRPIDMLGVLPIALSETGPCFGMNASGNPAPVPGAACDLVFDKNVTGLNGELSIDGDTSCENKGSDANELKDNIINGVQVVCSVGQTVNPEPGHNVGPTQEAMAARLAGEGSCEANSGVSSSDFAVANAALESETGVPLRSPSLSDGYDDFYEIWEFHGDSSAPADNLVAYDCDPSTPGVQTSPRNVTVIIVHDYADPDSGKQYLIRGFARVYIDGCSDKDGTFHKDCDWKGGGKLTIHSRFVEQVGLTNSELGLSNYGDIEVHLVH